MMYLFIYLTPIEVIMIVYQVKSDIEKRLQEKEEEFLITKKNHQRMMEQIQVAVYYSFFPIVLRIQ